MQCKGYHLLWPAIHLCDYLFMFVRLSCKKIRVVSYRGICMMNNSQTEGAVFTKGSISCL